jgi:DNA-binding response OmpR family regulator
LVVRFEGTAGAVSVLRVVRPTAVLLDLDLPGQTAWQVAESLLAERTCPPVILFTASRHQFDVKTAIRAGCLVDRSAGPPRLLEAATEALAMSESARVQRNAVQKVLIRWLKPCYWPLPFTSVDRYYVTKEQMGKPLHVDQEGA